MFDRCRSWRSLLTRRAEGELSPSERALLDDHLTRCGECREHQEADKALHALCLAHDAGIAVRSPRTFDDRVVSELRALPPDPPRNPTWRDRVRGFSRSLSFEFCMQLAGGGLVAASITGFMLVSALKPTHAPQSISAYEMRSLSAADRNEPPVPLESIFQSSTPRAALLWGAPGHTARTPWYENRPAKPVPAPGRRSAPRRHGQLTDGAIVG